MIRLRVPGSLTYRNLALRVVTAACALARPPDPAAADDEFDAQTVTAVGEAFNNIAIHGYSASPGDVDIEIEIEIHQILIRMMDTGLAFDPSAVPEPALDELPESGMGLFIMNSFMDEVTYTAGNPNVLCMIKRRSGGAGFGSAPPDPESDRSDGQSGWRIMGSPTSNPTSSSDRSGV
jgi:serine/threonine-protein kinase RsbW